MKLTVPLLLLLLLAPNTLAQNKTIVSGTITDPNGVPYAGGQISADLTPAGGTPTVAGNQINGYVPPVGLDSNGHFSISMFCNAAGGGCTPIDQAGTRWRFTVTNPGVQPPVGTGPVSFVVVVTVTGSTQDLSSTLSAAAPLLYRSSSGSGCIVSGNLGDVLKNNGIGGCSPSAANDSGGNFSIFENAVFQGPAPYADVIAYGAKCDGTTDDTVAFQNAINAVMTNGPTFNGVRTVGIPRGGKCVVKPPLPNIIVRGVQIIGNLGERPEESGGASIEFTPSVANATLFTIGAPKVANILSIARVSNVVTATTSPLPAGGGSWQVGHQVVVAGETGDSTFNGTFALSTVSGGTTLKWAQTAADSSPAASGTVAGQVDSPDYDGVQGFSIHHLELRCDGSVNTPLDNGTGQTYCTGATGVQDNRGGDVVLDDVNFEHWAFGFYGIQSDIDKFSNVNGGKNHVLAYVGPRSDQMHWTQAYTGSNDVVLYIDGARGGRYSGFITVDDGSPVSAPYRIVAQTGTANYNLFDSPWLEHSGTFQNQLAFFEIGGIQQVDGAFPMTDLRIKNPEIHLNAACCSGSFFTHYLAVVNNADFIRIDDPWGSPNDFSSLLNFEGSTSPANIEVWQFGSQNFTLSSNGGSGTPNPTEISRLNQKWTYLNNAGSYSCTAGGSNLFNCSGGTFGGGITLSAGNFSIPGASQFQFSGVGSITMPSSGHARFLNQANSTFTQVTLGLENSSTPAIRPNGAGFDFKLGDNSAFTNTNQQFINLETPIAVSALPSAASVPGQVRMVNDSTAVASEGQTCTGGSSNNALAFSNGSVWKCF